MKTINVAAAVLLLGLSTAVSAQMMGKCGGNGMQQGNMQGRMMMSGDMQHDKTMMMQHLDSIKTCVNDAKTSQELNACNMQMRQGGPMMQNQMNGKPMKQKGNMPLNNQRMQNNNMPMNGDMPMHDDPDK